MDHPDVRRHWAERTGEYSPAYYAHYGPDETSEAIGRHLSKRLDRDATVLELGFGSGRHLSHLYDRGFDRLAGVEVNEDAREVVASAYPSLADEGTLYFEAIEDVVGTFEDGYFDAVFSVETLQHIHPEADWVLPEIQRITEEVLITVENEAASDVTTPPDESVASPGPAVAYVNDEFPLYHRDWYGVFTDLGFVEVASQSIDTDTLRVFSTD